MSIGKCEYVTKEVRVWVLTLTTRDPIHADVETVNNGLTRGFISMVCREGGLTPLTDNEVEEQ